MPQLLEVSFTPSLEDLVALHTTALKRSPTLRKRLILSWVVIPVGLCTLAIGLWVAGVYEFVAIGIALAGVLVALFFPLVRRSWIVQWAWQHARMTAEGGLGPITLTLSDDEFRVRGKVTDTTARWENMKGVVAGLKHTIIVVTEQLVVIVPRSALGNDTNYMAVRDFALAKLERLA